MTTHQKSKIRNQQLPRGFTLVELLVTIVVISILAGITLTAMGTAREGARVRKTRATIATLHDLLMERYESYRYRRVPVRINTTDNIASDYVNPSDDRNFLQNVATVRLNALRELMKIELPERWSDVTDMPALLRDASGTPIRTALSEAYLRRYTQINQANASNPTRPNQSAECLYLIITMATADGEARSFFGDKEIGDVDNDGASEFLDAWGNPISFIRWPAGVVSELQPLKTGGTDPIADRDPDGDHDPFDSLRVDPLAYRLVPLIYSAGSDSKKDIVATGNGWTPSIDPYEDVTHNSVVVGRRGTPYDDEGDGEEWHDNIHNHLIGVR